LRPRRIRAASALVLLGPAWVLQQQLLVRFWHPQADPPWTPPL